MTPSEMGRKGGKATSEAKKKAARDNGKKGGRPKKTKAE
jgi:general stress protein YciG